MEDTKARSFNTVLAVLMSIVLAITMTPMPAYADDASAITNASQDDLTAEAETTLDTAISVPQGKTLTYNGEWQLGIDPAEGWTYACADGDADHFDPETGCRKLNAGTYTCTLRLNEGYVWDNGSYEDAVVTWSIQAKAITAPAGSELAATGQIQQGVSTGEGYDLSGDIEASETGSYTAIATLQPNYIWDDGNTDPKQVAWSIIANKQPSEDQAAENEAIEKDSEDQAAEASATENPNDDESLSAQALGYIDYPEGNTFTYGNWRLENWLGDNYRYHNGEYVLWNHDINGPVATASCDTIYLDDTDWYCYEPGQHSITYTLMDGYCWSDGYRGTYTVTLEAALLDPADEYAGYFDISDCHIELDQSIYTYNGKAKRPSVYILGDIIDYEYCEGGAAEAWYYDELTEGEHYTLSYSSNVNPGTATVTIKGIGIYQGKTDINFVIAPKTNGWLKADGSWYYKTWSGLASGWKTIDGVKYYFNPKTNKMATGLWTINGKKYYFNSSGAMTVNSWKSYNGSWYYFTSSGAAKSGWLSQGGTWYYLNTATNKMVTGLKSIGGKTYYFNSNGAMASNHWRRANDGSWYYFTSSGAAKKGWLQCGSDWYWFDSTGKGATAEGAWTGDSYSFFDYDGTWIKSASSNSSGWIRATDRTYYYDGDWCDWDSHLYYIDSSGNLAGVDSNGDDRRIGNYRYYFDDRGRAYMRYSIYDGAVENWYHDSSCYRYHGCDGCGWEYAGYYWF